MKTRRTDRLVALQFLAVVLPVVVVLLMQMVADSRRAAALGRSRPLHELAQHARADYKSFMSGVADAVDTGTLSGQAAEALGAAADGLGKLASQGESALAGSAAGTVKSLSGNLAKGAEIAAIMPLRENIKLADKLTKDIDDELDRRDEAVVEDAVTSARRQQIAVVAALFVSFLVTAFFVVSTQRRLRTQVAADQRFAEEELRRQLAADRVVAEESLRVRNALDNCSIGIMVADASGAIVHANRAASAQLAAADHALRARGFSEGCKHLVGGHLDQLAGKPGLTASLTRGYTGAVELDGNTFRMAIDPVLDADGARVGYVVEWADRTPEIALEREVAAVVAAAAKGDFSQRIGNKVTASAGVANEFNQQLTAGINRLLETSQVGLEDIARVLEAFAGGNLTERIHRDYEGTFAKVKSFSNRTAATLEVMIGKIKQASDEIATATREISRGNEHLSERTEQQAAGLEETVSSIADITGMVRTNSQGAQQASAHADGALSVARQGGQIVHDLVNTMSDITASSAKINDIIEVIDSIAFQTNILALNAAVEAARAGEQGRGFSVVASEVRTLAQRSRSAAKEIRELIGRSVEQVREGSKLVDTAGKTMAEIVDAVARVTTIIGEISESSQAQTTSIEQVNTAISEIDQTTQQNASLVEEATAAAASLETQASVLVTSVAAFRLSETRRDAARGIPHAA